tara:strand:+ start:179 stop:1255 length:1077 start_codon:yes stop_codon:yes gene_type:complete
LDRNLLENNYKKANNQLFNIDGRKLKIKKEIYSLYDLYLQIIRSNLQLYVGEAIKALLDLSGNGISVKDQKTTLFIENDLKNIVNRILPFLTIEQLSIKKEYKIANRIKDNIELKSNYDLKEEDYTSKNFENINGNDTTNYFDFYNYNLANEDIYKNINIDNILENKYFDNFKHDESFGCINYTILLKDFDEDKLSINIHQSKDSKYFIPVEFKDIILWIDTLDSSLNLYLKNLSIEINNELFKKNIFKSFINNDLLFYIFDNNFLFNNPSPFLLSFDPSLLSQYLTFDENLYENKFSKISLININCAELEFININLNMLRNKILEFKSSIYSLIKKENYWSNKLKINSNIESTLNQP